MTAPAICVERQRFHVGHPAVSTAANTTNKLIVSETGCGRRRFTAYLAHHVTSTFLTLQHRWAEAHRGPWAYLLPDSSDLL